MKKRESVELQPLNKGPNKLDESEPEVETRGFFIDTFIRFRGLILQFISAFFLALSGILIRKATFCTASEQTAVRNLIQMLIMIAIAVYNKLNIFGPRDQRTKLILRGLLGSTAIITIAYSIKFINPSDSQALYNTRLIIISILARFFLKEKMSIVLIFCLILTITGVLLIAQPSFLVSKPLVKSVFLNESLNGTDAVKPKPETSSILSYVGILLGIISAFCASCVAILVKKLSNSNVHYAINTCYSSYLGLPIALIIALVTYFTGNRVIDPTSYDTTEKLIWQIFFLIASALCGCLFVSLQVMSNRYEEANKLAIMSTTNLFWSFALQYIILNISPNLLSAIGALLIFIAIIASIVMKIADGKNNKKKAKLSSSGDAQENNCFKKVLFFKF